MTWETSHANRLCKKLCAFEMFVVCSGFTSFPFFFFFLKYFLKLWSSVSPDIQLERITANKQFSYSVCEFPLRNEKEERTTKKVELPSQRGKEKKQLLTFWQHLLSSNILPLSSLLDYMMNARWLLFSPPLCMYINPYPHTYMAVSWREKFCREISEEQDKMASGSCN